MAVEDNPKLTRRDFLRITAGAGAAAVLTACAPQLTPPAPQKPVFHTDPAPPAGVLPTPPQSPPQPTPAARQKQLYLIEYSYDYETSIDADGSQVETRKPVDILRGDAAWLGDSEAAEALVEATFEYLAEVWDGAVENDPYWEGFKLFGATYVVVEDSEIGSEFLAIIAAVNTRGEKLNILAHREMVEAGQPGIMNKSAAPFAVILKKFEKDPTGAENTVSYYELNEKNNEGNGQETGAATEVRLFESLAAGHNMEYRFHFLNSESIDFHEQDYGGSGAVLAMLAVTKDDFTRMVTPEPEPEGPTREAADLAKIAAELEKFLIRADRYSAEKLEMELFRPQTSVVKDFGIMSEMYIYGIAMVQAVMLGGYFHEATRTGYVVLGQEDRDGTRFAYSLDLPIGHLEELSMKIGVLEMDTISLYRGFGSEEEYIFITDEESFLNFVNKNTSKAVVAGVTFARLPAAEEATIRAEVRPLYEEQMTKNGIASDLLRKLKLVGKGMEHYRWGEPDTVGRDYMLTAAEDVYKISSGEIVSLPAQSFAVRK